MIYFVRYIALLLVAVLLAACTAQAPEPRQGEGSSPQTFVTTPVAGTPAFTEASPEAGYPGLSATDTATDGYPAPTTTGSSDGRSESALTSYQVAEERAKRDFDPQAQLYNISPSHIMLNNLGNPPVLPGWFYTFKVPDGSRRQYIVQVVDGQITGTTLAEAIEEATPAEQPLNVAEVKVDSPQVFDLFEAEMAKQGTATDRAIYDLELVKLAGQSNPVWSVVDPETQKWLFSVNAVTGEVVPTLRQ